VGPRSAGAEPGPACLGAGEELTVTDANLLLGRLDPDYFLGGRISLDLPRTQRIAKEFAAALNLNVRALAEGIVRIANANMERAMRVVSVQRGFDPRDFALLAFGGAGGLHACDLAASLDIATVLIPEHAGVLSALGMLLADVARDYSASVLQSSAHLSAQDLQQKLEPLIKRAHADLSAEGFASEAVILTASLAMRYQGQAFEIDVPLSCNLHEPGMHLVAEEFHARHQKLYGYSNPRRATEAVQLRLRAAGRTAKPVLAATGKSETQSPPEPDAARNTIFGKRSIPTPVYHRSRLAPGNFSLGPAIILTGESTSIIPPHWAWRIDGAGTLVVTHSRAHVKKGGDHAF
jgi:N-methylhydantoinase A/oxoprolinase/acetone carboxylase beta subunit